jgi:hypothetical protein
MEEFSDLRAKIEEAKPLLPLPALIRELGHEEKHKTARCPFHSDEHPSFSVFHSSNGKGWQWKCHAGCGNGDEIDFLVKHFGISKREAITRYLEMAGFPPTSPLKSREWHISPKSPASLGLVNNCVSAFPVSPVSEGQGIGGELDKKLTALAERNACMSAGAIGAKKRFKLARDVKALEKKLDRKLNANERKRVFNEWHRLSEPYLDLTETRDDHFTAFLAELGKVKVPTGEGTITKALGNVSKLVDADLPLITDWPGAPIKCRRLFAFHCELSRLCGGKTYFLSYRDAAKVCEGLSHQEAHTITGALETVGVIKIVSKGKAGVNSRKAAEFRYLLPESENDNGYW